MDAFETQTLLAISGFGLGLVMGITARAARFCTFSTIEEFVLSGRTLRLKSWALAIAVAMAGVQVLYAAGVERVGEAFYLSSNLGLAGVIVGGLLFGLGMSMVGTCSFGVIIRMAGGDLKALVSFLIIGISGYMAARGLTSLFKAYAIDSIALDVSRLEGQGIHHMLGGLSGLTPEQLWLPLGLVISALIVCYCFYDRDFRYSRHNIVAGLVIGLAVTGGFLVTGTLGADPFNEVRVQSLTYVMPVGETIMWLMTFTGAQLTFPIAAVIGTLCGASAVAAWRKELRLESFDDPREMGRHIVGAAAMGTGGILAAGCTIGQGVSGVSTLAVSSILSLALIFIGAVFGINMLLTGSISESWHLIYARWRRL